MALAIGTVELIILGLLFFVFLIIGSVVAIVILSRIMWPFKVTIAEAVGNNPPMITRRTRARLIAFGDGGEEIFKLKKPKKLRGAYGKRIGLRQVLWVIGDDGLWYNTEFGNFNKKLLEIGLSPVDRDVRLSNSSIRKGIEKNYGTKSFMEKYGTFIYFGLFMFAILVFSGVMWYVFKSQKEIMSANLETMKLAQEVLSGIANIRSGGTGFIPA